jgi:hypothetical protein
MHKLLLTVDCLLAGTIWLLKSNRLATVINRQQPAKTRGTNTLKDRHRLVCHSMLLIMLLKFELWLALKVIVPEHR